MKTCIKYRNASQRKLFYLIVVIVVVVVIVVDVVDNVGGDVGGERHRCQKGPDRETWSQFNQKRCKKLDHL